jgi:tRNA A-37 threonylcarbamoyl transferase component Bud32
VEDALTSGARIGSYEVLDRLGAGGMGEVYRARDTRLGRTVAIKVLRRGADPELLHRLDREARAASALNHPNIVQIYDVGETPGPEATHYVVMEHVQGETLRRRLGPGPLPLGELLDLGSQLADGLAKAHRAGIVHRDLKPENVMVTPDGLLKILDFGLAKLVIAPLSDVEGRETMTRHGTQLGVLMGTLEYMSPEQATGQPVDHRTDQFSVGLILHEMATGRPAFRRGSAAQVLAAVIERDPEPLGRLRADVPPPLEELVSRCLQKDRQKRFAKTDDLAAELATLSSRSRAGTLAGLTAPGRVEPPPLPEALGSRPVPPPPVYHVQTGGRVRQLDEGEVANRIRRGKLSGEELVRRDDEEEWQPLYESRVFKREVPWAGDPRDARHARHLKALGGHFGGYFITGVVMLSTHGSFPFWMAIWGAVLLVQVAGSVPAMIALVQRFLANRQAARPVQIEVKAQDAAPLKALPPPVAALPQASSAVAQEAARVRALIEQRGGPDAPKLVAEVDGILKMTADLAERQADLEEQTSEGERASLAAAITEARTRLDKAELAQDRRLFERQLDVLQGREDAILKAMRVLERLRVRREVAEHQLKQLRLDLSRSAASGLDVPELSSRLQFIRFEVDAKEEVAEIGADRA